MRSASSEASSASQCSRRCFAHVSGYRTPEAFVHGTTTAVGIGVGVGLIVALLAITNGVHRTAQDLLHVGRADFGLYQADVSDFPRSLLPDSLASSVARDPGVAAVARVKLLVEGGTLVFGLAPDEFAYRRLVVVAGTRGPVLAGDRSGKRLGEVVDIAGRAFTIRGIYHSGDRFRS